MATVAQLVAQLDAGDLIEATQARAQLMALVWDVCNPARQTERSALADGLVAELVATVEPVGPVATNVPESVKLVPVPKYSAASRRLICQLLTRIAGDEQLPKLITLWGDLDVRDAVRCVLETIGTQPATTALNRGLRVASPEFRVGILNALGRQGWSDATAALALSTEDPDPQVRLAALEGLANFPETANDKYFVAALQTGTPRERARAAKARVRFAETLYLFGENESAATVYRAIAADAPDGPWRRAAHPPAR